MNYLIQRGKVRGQVINVPEGLPELLSDIAREVLRCQPAHQCLCQFIIDYLHSVIVTREKAKAAKSIIDRALHKVDEIIKDMCICSITKEKAEEMALVMEECFKRFLEQRRCETGKKKEIIRFDQDDLLDELIKKCKFSEDELKVSRPLIEEAYNRFAQAYSTAAKEAEGTESLYQYFRERETERWKERLRHDAATKIQAVFRGFLVRRSLVDNLMPKGAFPLGPLDDIPSELFRDMDRAARIIQKFFRERIEGHKFAEEDGEGPSAHQSKETIVEEGAGETAPDVRPQEVSEVLVQEEQTVGEEAKVEEVETSKEVEATAPEETEAVPEAPPEPAPAAAPEPAEEPVTAEPVAEVAEPEPEPEPPQPEAAAPEEPPAAEAQAEEEAPAAEQPPAE